MVQIVKRGVALKMRQGGETYTSIRSHLNVSKSTLSYWLRDIQLSDEQRATIKKNAVARRVESYIETTRKRREKIFQQYVEIEKGIILPLSRRDLLIAGLFLYLGEGGKSGWWNANLSNSDPGVIRFGIKWFTEILGVPTKKIKIFLQLYSDMNVKKEVAFWKKITGLPRKQFGKPYIKKSTSLKIEHRTFGHGTCQISVSDTKIKNKILAGMKVILDTAIMGV